MSAVLNASPAISCRDIGMRFFTERRDVTAIKSLDLDVAQGEFLTLLGPSGCGKSTFLRVVADLLEPSRGKIDVLCDHARRPHARTATSASCSRTRRCCPGARRCRTSSCRCRWAVAPAARAAARRWNCSNWSA